MKSLFLNAETGIQGSYPGRDIDVVDAIDAASAKLSQEGGGELIFPALPRDYYYAISRPAKAYDHVIWSGEGEQSHIRNIRSKADFPGSTSILIYAGISGRDFAAENVTKQRSNTYGVYDLDNGPSTETQYTLDPFQRNAQVVSLKTQTLSNIKPGDIVFISSRRGHQLHSVRAAKEGGGHTQPYYQDMNEVIRVEKNGKIVLKYPCYAEVADPQLAISTGQKINVIGAPVKITKGAGLKHLKLSQVNQSHAIIQRGGMFECSFDNIIFDGWGFLVVNAMARCKINGIEGVASHHAIETAYWCAFNAFENIRIAKSDDADPKSSFITASGASHHTYYKNVMLTSEHAEVSTGIVVGPTNSQGSSFYTFENVDINISNLLLAGVRFGGGEGDDKLGNYDNHLINVNVTTSSPQAKGFAIHSQQGDPSRPNKLLQCSYRGPGRYAVFFSNDTDTPLIIEGGYFEGEIRSLNRPGLCEITGTPQIKMESQQIVPSTTSLTNRNPDATPKKTKRQQRLVQRELMEEQRQKRRKGQL
jgi:hypothetical protein